jgi:hypothetical protein
MKSWYQSRLELSCQNDIYVETDVFLLRWKLSYDDDDVIMFLAPEPQIQLSNAFKERSEQSMNLMQLLSKHLYYTASSI